MRTRFKRPGTPQSSKSRRTIVRLAMSAICVSGIAATTVVASARHAGAITIPPYFQGFETHTMVGWKDRMNAKMVKHSAHTGVYGARLVGRDKPISYDFRSRKNVTFELDMRLNRSEQQVTLLQLNDAKRNRIYSIDLYRKTRYDNAESQLIYEKGHLAIADSEATLPTNFEPKVGEWFHLKVSVRNFDQITLTVDGKDWSPDKDKGLVYANSDPSRLLFAVGGDDRNDISIDNISIY